MFHVRLHGRGGQGVKTASRILGSSLFLEGFEVQDAPRYGAERRGAPIFAYVRAAREPIHERGLIHSADLVVAVDDSLMAVPAAGITADARKDTVLLLRTDEDAEEWRQRVRWEGPLLTLETDSSSPSEARFAGAVCAGAAARLLGVVSRESLQEAVRTELERLGPEVLDKNLTRALTAYDSFGDQEGCVQESQTPAAQGYTHPDWIDLPFEDAGTAAPDVYGAANSVLANTGTWRTLRPEIDADVCRHCWWVCSTLCPDGTILVRDGRPEIDYDHCKGCMICATVCPPGAISVVPEQTPGKEARP